MSDPNTNNIQLPIEQNKTNTANNGTLAIPFFDEIAGHTK